jgi:hypothetical protein
LAAKFLKVKLPSDGDKVWWQDFDVTPRQLEGWSLFAKPVMKHFLLLYFVYMFCIRHALLIELLS